MNGESEAIWFKEGVDSAEYSICGWIFASEVPPAFDDPLVITVDLKVPANISKPNDRPDEKLEAESFCPTNVSLSIQ